MIEPTAHEAGGGVTNLEETFVVSHVFNFISYLETEKDPVAEDILLTTVYQTGFTVSVSELTRTSDAGCQAYEVFFNHKNTLAPHMKQRAFRATRRTDDQITVECLKPQR